MPYFDLEVTLPIREGPRPIINGLAPQRQISHQPSRKQIGRNLELLKALAEANTDVVEIRQSGYESLNPVAALYTKFNPKFGEKPRNIPYMEFVHHHVAEGSYHAFLHPRDVAYVIKQGWGERHPLAGRKGWMKEAFQDKGLTAYWHMDHRDVQEGWLPSGFMLIYAPREPEEMEAVREIIKAAGWALGGYKLKDGKF